MPVPPLTKRSTARIVSRIETHKRMIAKHRDRLADLRDELESICECCDEADAALRQAIDAR